MVQQKQNIVKTISDYGRRLFGFIGKVNTDEDAEDILQEVYVPTGHNRQNWKILKASAAGCTEWRRIRSPIITETKNFFSAEDDANDDKWMVPSFMVSGEGGILKSVQLKKVIPWYIVWCITGAADRTTECVYLEWTGGNDFAADCR